MKVCKKCGYPIGERFVSRYCRACGGVMYLLQGYDKVIGESVTSLEQRLHLEFSKKEKRRLIHYLTMKKVKAESNGRFFSKPRQPIIGAWLFK